MTAARTGHAILSAGLMLLALAAGCKRHLEEPARQFIAFVRFDHAKQVFREHGFTLSEPTTRPD